MKFHLVQKPYILFFFFVNLNYVVIISQNLSNTPQAILSDSSWTFALFWDSFSYIFTFFKKENINYI